ncbi:MAG: hypothetical protein IT427_05625 [Pirellulales bacterium]|nr:hypothetical protein [Pirellulales bacterium]
MNRVFGCYLLLLFSIGSIGCRSPYYQDQGALAGGLGGAGLGAIIGSTTGHAGAGAAIGAAAGALTGGMVGGALDEIDAKNRAQIAAQMGRPLPAGAVSVEDVVAMSQSKVDEQLMINQINNHGMNRTIQSGDLIALQNSGVSTRVIAAMQQPRAVAGPPGPVVVEGAPPVVVAQPVYYGPPPYWGPPPYRTYGAGVVW